MKYTKYILLSLAIITINIAHAAPNTRSMHLPFYNQPIVTENYSGLHFEYRMDRTQGRVVCRLFNIYKAWIKFPDAGAEHESPAYGFNKTVILSSKSKTDKTYNEVDILHADAAGSVTVNAILWGDVTHSTASCYYQPEPNK